ncbi:MAG: aminopeptidase N [Jatrophihabitantaceae bacterium]
MPSLTRADAARRAALLRISAYDVRLDLTRGPETFDSVTTIRFECLGPAEPTFLDVKPDTLRAVVLNGERLDVTALADGRLPLDGLRAENEIVVDALMAYSHDGEGLHRHVDPVDGNVYLYAMSFLDAAPRWFACFDQPDLKAPLTLSVTCPPDWTVAGNGAATSLAPGEWRLAPTGPLATYFTTLIAGPYHSIRAQHDGIPLALHARASLAEHLDRDAEELFTITRGCLDEFHRLFGARYPWGEYHQAFVPEFNAGAMENPGCVTFRDPMIFRSAATDADRGQRASTIAHEMAHMWFGDLVTMRWWDDLWLNESFAEYLGHRVCDAVTEYDAWLEFGIVRKAWGHAADRRPSTHPVAGNGAADAASALTDFDGISYAKGASVLRQLATHLGDEVFLGGLRDYFAAHRFANAELADLLAAWTAAGARELPDWSDQWLGTSGLDTLRVVDGQLLRESPASACPAERTHALSVAAFDAAGVELARAAVTVRSARTPVDVPAGSVLVLPDAGDETWAKVALAPPTWAAVPALLPRLDPMARVGIWNALRLAVADADVDPRLAVDILVPAIEAEPSDAVVGSVLRWAKDALLGAYLSDEAARAAGERMAAAAWRIATTAPPASGRQLAGMRATIGVSADPAQLGAWLESRELPEGLALDAELRWSVLARLAALGALDVAGIDDEAQRDPSSQGLVHAVRCRTLRPDAAAKQVAWDSLMHDADCPNYQLYAIADSFWRRGQSAYTAPYLERYFAEIAQTSVLRSGWALGQVALLAYPRSEVSERTLTLTGELLSRPDLADGIRRSVVDAGDDLRRALASRETYRA